MYESIQIDVPLALIPCDNCKSELSKEGRQSDLDYHMTKVNVNSDSDEGIITVPLDVQRLLLKKMGKGEYRVNAVFKTVCPSCQEFREWTYQLQAPTVFLKSNCHCRVCGSLLEMASDDEFDYVDDGKGSWEINASVLLVCPNCKDEWISDMHIQMPDFKRLQKVDSYDVQYHYGQNSSNREPERQLMAQIRDVLSDLYDDESNARIIVHDAGINGSSIIFSGTSQQIWHYIIQEAQKQNKVKDVLHVASEQYRDNRELKNIIDMYREHIAQEAS